MVHAVDQLLGAEYVDVEVVCTLREVSVHDVDQLLSALLVIVAESVRAHGLGVGDAVERELVRNLRNAVEGGKKSALLCTVGRICSR